MIHRGKKLRDIAFESKTGTTKIPTHIHDKFCQTTNCLMRALPQAAGIRVKNKTLIKYRIQYSKYGMMHHAISNCGFVDDTVFRIANSESLIWSVAINFAL